MCELRYVPPKRRSRCDAKYETVVFVNGDPCKGDLDFHSSPARMP